VVRAGVLLRDPEPGELGLEAVAGRPAAPAAGEPCRIDQPVVREHAGGQAVGCGDGPERGQDDRAGDGPVAGGGEQVAGVVIEPVQDLHVGAAGTAVGQRPVGEVGLPDLIGQVGLEAAVGALRPLPGIGDDGAVPGQNPRHRGDRDAHVFLAQVPGDGVRTSVQAPPGQLRA
jgi:hypothetical protein